ncbi:hypothetical protein [Algoriphagus aquimarinus]|uniref:hypothetical protein n=1 Tax=Algoriphagus aquimarinus TaxID=237018 RepID=UPI0030DB3792|tara:strand:+ start:2618 stop:3478 length:861 start_codon:yes stop_codon:yes gene_type:complete
MDLWIISIPLLISSISLGIVIYKEFFGESKLETVLDNLIFLGCPEENRASIILEIILDDILSGRLNSQIETILKANPSIINAANFKNRELLKTHIIEHSNFLNKMGQSIIYDPSEEEIKKYISNDSLPLSFYIPLNISNSGRRSGDISNIILKIIDKGNPKNKWSYYCFAEFKSEDFLNDLNKPLGFSIRRVFPGLSLPHGNSQRIDGFFIPMETANNKIISRKRMKEGEFTIQIIGYNSRSKRCLQSNISEFTLTTKTLIDSFNGINIMRNLSLENQIEKEFEID